MQGFSKLMSCGFMQGQIFKNNLFVERIMPLAVKHKLAPEVIDHYRDPLRMLSSRAGVAAFPREITAAALWLGAIADEVPDRLGRLPLLLTLGGFKIKSSGRH